MEKVTDREICGWCWNEGCKADEKLRAEKVDVCLHMKEEEGKEECAKGTSMEPGSLADIYATMSMRATQEAVRIGVEAGTREAEKRLEEGKKKYAKGRLERRQHNTRLLLANYRNLKEHVAGAVCSGRKANETALEILEGLDDFEYEDNYVINSIKQSQQRTMIILSHIDAMLNLYRIACEQSSKPEEMRHYRVLYAAYIDPERKSAEEIAKENDVEKRTYYSDIRKAIKPLSALFFGIDGVRLT